MVFFIRVDSELNIFYVDTIYMTSAIYYYTYLLDIKFRLKFIIAVLDKYTEYCRHQDIFIDIAGRFICLFLYNSI